MELNYASKGVAGTGLGLGIAGTALGILNGGAGLLSLGTNGTGTRYITKDEFDMSQKLTDKDMQIAILSADNNVDKKLLEVYTALNNKANEIYAEVRGNEKEQLAVNAAQAVVNAQVAANIAVNQNNITALQNQLGGLTKTVIPINNVCPQPMPLYNSFTCPDNGGTTVGQ